MGQYQHFIRKNEAMVIVHGFSSGFEQPQPGDYLIGDNEIRHFQEFFTESLTNEHGQFRFKWVGNKVTERTQQEISEELEHLPPPTPTLQEQLDEMKLLLGDLLLFGGV